MITRKVLEDAIFVTIKKSSCVIPPDVHSAFEKAIRSERSIISKRAFEATLASLDQSIKRQNLACPDTGWPLFFSGYSPKYGKGGVYWYVPNGDAGPVYFSYAMWGPVWSADGTRVTFGHGRGSRPDIWTDAYVYETNYGLLTPLSEP